MKKIIGSFIFLFFLPAINAQITDSMGGLNFEDSLEFRPMHPWITIEDPEKQADGSMSNCTGTGGQVTELSGGPWEPG